jgi:hypothetical protein
MKMVSSGPILKPASKGSNKARVGMAYDQWIAMTTMTTYDYYDHAFIFPVFKSDKNCQQVIRNMAPGLVKKYITMENHHFSFFTINAIFNSYVSLPEGKS